MTLIFLLLQLRPAAISAQSSAPLALVVSDSGVISLTISELLSTHELLNAIEAGLPVRVQADVELWKDRFFDSRVGGVRWRASIVFDPLEGVYDVEFPGEELNDSLVAFTVNSLPEAEAALAEHFRIPLRPDTEGRFYYLADFQVETLSVNDLGELRRWLQGDLRPAVEGEGEVEGALDRGLQRLLVRMLRLPSERYELRSAKFLFDPARGVIPSG